MHTLSQDLFIHFLSLSEGRWPLLLSDEYVSHLEVDTSPPLTLSLVNVPLDGK